MDEATLSDHHARHTAATRAIEEHTRVDRQGSHCACGWDGSPSAYPAHVAAAVLHAIDVTASQHRPDKPPVDLHGFADMIGVNVQTLRTYRKDGRLPPPDGRIGRTDWWHPATIRMWQSNRPGRGVRRSTMSATTRGLKEQP